MIFETKHYEEPLKNLLHSVNFNDFPLSSLYVCDEKGI